MQTRHVMILAAAVVSMGLAGCGNQPAPKDEAGSKGASQAATTGQVDRCPLTAEQVSAVVGAQVVGPNDGVCVFYPPDADPTVRPNVTFVRQVSFACNGTMPTEAGLTEQVQGLGVTAYFAEETAGARLLVCQGQTPFELEVDAQTPQLRRDAALALARQVLAGR